LKDHIYLMAQHKKQHYIPKSYLKEWCDLNIPQNHTPYLWIFDKDTNIPKKKAPDNIFHETDFYTIFNENGGKDLSIEQGFSGLEKQFSIIRRKKLLKRKKCTPDEHFEICVFIAAMHSRTKSRIKDMGKMWNPVLQMMESMIEHMDEATDKEKLTQELSLPSSSTSESINYDELKSLSENPIELMISLIEAEAPMLLKLDFMILCTDDKQGFITSDNPCIWRDLEGHKRPKMYQAPALIYETIEIIFPISPRQCILLNRKGRTGYVDVDSKIVAQINQIVYHNSHSHYISNHEIALRLYSE